MISVVCWTVTQSCVDDKKQFKIFLFILQVLSVIRIEIYKSNVGFTHYYISWLRIDREIVLRCGFLTYQAVRRVLSDGHHFRN